MVPIFPLYNAASESMMLARQPLHGVNDAETVDADSLSFLSRLVSLYLPHVSRQWLQLVMIEAAAAGSRCLISALVAEWRF